MHKGPWHLAVTMIPMLFMGALVEKHIGSILFFLFIIICWVLSATLEVAMATMLYHVFHSLFHDCSMGFSGIVFGVTTVLSQAVKPKQCGLCIFQVPIFLLPWIFVVVYYVCFHHGAVFLHLGGIIAGSSAIIMTLFSPERFSSFNALHACVPE